MCTEIESSRENLNHCGSNTETNDCDIFLGCICWPGTFSYRPPIQYQKYNKWWWWWWLWWWLWRWRWWSEAIRSHTILSTPDFLPQIGRESNNGAPLVRELPIIPDIIKLSWFCSQKIMKAVLAFLGIMRLVKNVVSLPLLGKASNRGRRSKQKSIEWEGLMVRYIGRREV